MDAVLKDKIDIFLLERYGIVNGVYKNIHDYRISREDFLACAYDRQGNASSPLEFMTALGRIEKTAWTAEYIDDVLASIQEEFTLNAQEEDDVCEYLSSFRCDLSKVLRAQKVYLAVSVAPDRYASPLELKGEGVEKYTFFCAVSLYDYVVLLDRIDNVRLYAENECVMRFSLLYHGAAYVCWREGAPFSSPLRRTSYTVCLLYQDIKEVFITAFEGEKAEKDCLGVFLSDYKYMEV